MNSYAGFNRRFIIISAIGHLLLFSFLIYNQKKREASNRVIISATVIQAVDAENVGLPNVLKKDLGKVFNKNKAEDPSVMALPSLKELAVSKMKAIEKLKQSITDSDYLKKIKIIKGLRAGEALNKKTLGSTTPTGIGIQVEINTIGEIGSQYIEGIKALIQKFWSVPTWMNTDGLKVSILLTLKDDGSINNLEVFESSGNAEFDNFALNAVKKVEHFEAPPVAVRSLLVDEGVVLVFP